MSSTETIRNRARTKIVATVGPACRSPEKLTELILAGVNVFRLNMAHSNQAEHQALVNDIRAASQKLGQTVGILVDLAGPKIRLGELAVDPTNCELGGEYRFIRGAKSTKANELVSNYERLVDELQVGDSVMLTDGTVGMQVVAKEKDAAVCKVVGAGMIRSRQGINLPGVALSVPAMTDADWSNAEWAAKAEVDFVSLSFVRTPVEVLQLKDLLLSHSSSAIVISKIEKREALDRLDEIVAASDGVMVARGDLGVEIDVAETAVAQKRIVSACQRYVKPVIVATQMLDSMHHSTRPTRAEVSDVTNAILDGADACMLSGETAIGEFPRETVEMMNRIMLAAERTLLDRPPQPPPIAALAGVHPITSAVVYGASKIAQQLAAKFVVVATRTGGTARVMAKQRDAFRTVGVSDNPVALRKMTLFWGILPISGAPVANGPALRAFVADWGREAGMLASGDRVVYVTGSEVVQTAHNLVAVHEVE